MGSVKVMLCCDCTVQLPIKQKNLSAYRLVGSSFIANSQLSLGKQSKLHFRGSNSVVSETLSIDASESIFVTAWQQYCLMLVSSRIAEFTHCLMC